MTQPGDVVAIDVGNSAVKVAIRPRDEQTSVCRTFLLDDAGWATRLCDWVQSKVTGERLECWISTVNRAASTPLEQDLTSRFSEASWSVIRFDQLPIKIDVDWPDRVGIDRLIGGFEASKQFETHVVVVDAGSAVTIDWIQSDFREDGARVPVFSGGAILPGVRLQLAALARGTEAIKQVTIDLPESNVGQRTDVRFQPGKNTESAIRLGVVASLVGSVQRLAADYSAEKATPDVKLVITGGDADLVSRHLSVPHVVVPNLVCDGLFRLSTEVE